MGTMIKIEGEGKVENIRFTDCIVNNCETFLEVDGNADLDGFIVEGTIINHAQDSIDYIRGIHPDLSRTTPQDIQDALCAIKKAKPDQRKRAFADTWLGKTSSAALGGGGVAILNYLLSLL